MALLSFSLHQVNQTAEYKALNFILSGQITSATSTIQYLFITVTTTDSSIHQTAISENECAAEPIRKARRIDIS